MCGGGAGRQAGGVRQRNGATPSIHTLAVCSKMLCRLVHITSRPQARSPRTTIQQFTLRAARGKHTPAPVRGNTTRTRAHTVWSVSATHTPARVHARRHACTHAHMHARTAPRRPQAVRLDVPANHAAHNVVDAGSWQLGAPTGLHRRVHTVRHGVVPATSCASVSVVHTVHCHAVLPGTQLQCRP